MIAIEFRILGSVEVADGGLVKDLGGLRERTLLARLLLSAGQVVSADRLADDLSAGQPPPHYMATLRVYISRLRRALGDGSGAVATQPPGYRIVVGAGELDADRFGRLAASARDDMAAGRPAAAAERLREALGLWRGPALSDVADFAFAQAGVAALEEARLTAVEDRVEADLACGRHVSLAGELDGLAAAHPLRERLCGQRMLALYRCGRQADALAAYQDLRRLLGDDLGIDPNPRLQRLQEAILRQEPGLDWGPAGPVAGTKEPGGDRGPAREPGGDREAAETSGADGAAGASGPAAPPGTGAAGTGPAGGGTPGAAPPGPAARTAPGWLPAETTSFIGRESELATIEDLLGLSRLLTLTGPGGSGKTRLAIRAGAGPRPRTGIRAGCGWWNSRRSPAPAGRRGHGLRAGAQGGTGQAARRHHRRRPGPSEALLIIDNCEHVLDAAAGLIGGLLRACPSLRVLATSQSRLDLPERRPGRCRR